MQILRLFSQRICMTAVVMMTLVGAVGPSVYASADPNPNGQTASPSPATKPADSLFGKTIVVDAGHGGRDSGARGINDLQEKDITLKIALRLTRYLQEAGATVVMTRVTDTDLATESDRLRKRRHLGDLKGRMNVVRKQPVDAFVSVHCNAAPSPDWHGAQVLYLRDNDDAKRLATLMQQSFQENLLPTKRSIQSNRTLYLLKRVKGPAVLAEIGFITSPQEASSLRTPAYQDKAALAMYAALIRYFEAGNGGKED